MFHLFKISAHGLDFQHIPQGLANVNALKTMFDPYIDSVLVKRLRSAGI